jgi:3-oxoadipate enol-lactonase
MATLVVERMAVEIDGEGDAVLMIHGLGGTSNTWTPLLPALAGRRVIRPDLPGSGRSHRVEGRLGIARFVEAMHRVLAAAGETRAHVVGHSLGCIVALHLLVEAPRAVRSLALFGPLLAPPDTARGPLRARGEKARREGLAGMQEIADSLVEASTARSSREQCRAAIAYVRETLMRQDPDGYARSCEALAEAQAPDVAGVACPVLLVTGDEDAVAPPQSVRMLGERLGAAGAAVRTEVLRGCGHWEPLERPEECMDHLRRFHATCTQEPARRSP